jgi:hypothetical protein
MSPQTPHQTSPLLRQAGFTHAFFGRQGGVSTGDFSSLNFSTLTGDSEETVRQNLDIAARHLGVARTHLYFLTQVHGVAAKLVTGKEEQNAVEAEEGDIVLTRAPGVAAAIRTADCVSILLACPDTGWVSACHSGWQGCVKNAAGAAVRELEKHDCGRILAAIGPHISQAAFEVSNDVAEELLSASPDKDVVDRSQKKPHVDLRRMVRAQLVEAGLSDSDIDDVPGCTVQQEDNFFSFRRDREKSGRMLSAIVARQI